MYRRRSNKLVWLIGIPVIAFGLAKGGMYLKTKQMLDRFIAEQSSVASIRYAGLETALSGTIRINDVSITPLGEDEPIRIIQVLIKGPDAFNYLLRHNPVTGDEGPPEHLSVNFRGVSLNLQGEMARNLDSKLLNTVGAGGLTEAGPSPCSADGRTSFGTLAELGMKKLNLDAGFGYRYDRGNRTMQLNTDLDVEEIESLMLSATVSNFSPVEMQSPSMNLPGLDELAITLKVKPEFGSRLTDYCADQLGLSAPVYTELLSGELIQGLAENGVVLGPGLRSVVRKFYRDWGEVEIRANPASTLSLAGLMLAPPDNIEEKLGLELTLNGQFVTDLRFDLSKDSALLVRKKDTAKPKKAPERKPRFKREYRVVPAGSLGAHVGKPVRINVEGQPLRTGILMAVEGTQVQVEQRVEGGKFTAHVPLDDIDKVEAEFVVRIVDPPSTAEQAEQ